VRRILVANDLQGFKRLAGILKGEDVRFAQTLTEARQLLNSVRFDLVIAGVHFDDSRAVELLQIVRTNKKTETSPFVFIRTRHSSMALEIEKTINTLQKALDHSGLIETEMLSEDDELIRQEIFRRFEK
jgi:PleD family two-component response regulator